MSKEIKIIKFTESLYDVVGDKIREFCEKTYYGGIICSFEQSYDGKEWTKESEFASFENCTDLCYENDWNEGQTYLQNLRIWHLDELYILIDAFEAVSKIVDAWNEHEWPEYLEEDVGKILKEAGYI